MALNHLQPHAVLHQLRGTAIESVHPWSAAVMVEGTLTHAWGPDVRTTWRSAAKPLQLHTSLDVLGRPEVPDTWLAVGSASHSAEPVHVALVEQMLAHFGLHVGHLRCGTHPPSHTPSADAILRGGGEFCALHNNCSGKHTFMVAAAQHAGWDLDYLPATHPLQVRNRALVEDLCAATPTLAVDGCGVPTFDLPLSAIARAWGEIARAMRQEDALLGRIGRAMAAHPELTSGTDRLDLAVVRRAQGTLAVKVGAQGVFCMAIPELRAGVAIKVHSGAMEALPAAIDAVLSALWPSAWAPMDAWPLLDVRNVVGRVVGRWVPA